MSSETEFRTGRTSEGSPIVHGLYAMERRIADLESTNERLLERIAELEAANRLLASGVSPGYWRAGSRLVSREQAAQSDSALPPPTELGEPKRPRA